MKVFVPFSESLVEATGLGLGHLVPFQLEYECLRLGQVPAGLLAGLDSGRVETPEDDACEPAASPAEPELHLH